MSYLIKTTFADGREFTDTVATKQEIYEVCEIGSNEDITFDPETHSFIYTDRYTKDVTIITEVTHEPDSPLRMLNKALYNALCVLLAQHCNNKESGLNGFKFSENRYGELNDLIDELSVNYFGEEPDGDYAVEMKAKAIADPSLLFTDVQAYEAIMGRLTNLPL